MQMLNTHHDISDGSVCSYIFGVEFDVLCKIVFEIAPFCEQDTENGFSFDIQD
jgi:hypothetical protein